MATPVSQSAKPAWLTWAALGVCAMAVWAVFGGARGFHFVLWDDDYNLQQNPHLSGVTWDNLRWMFTDTAYSRRYFPLTWLGWNVEHDLFGLTAYSAHFGNVLFHLLNTVLVFLVIKAFLRLWLTGENAAASLATTTAATVGALLWALHPLRVEVVAWASGRIYAQAACFTLVSLWCYLRSIESIPGSNLARRFRWASAAALTLSLLTYPLALSFVGVLLIVDWYLPARLRPASAGSSRLGAVLRENIPFLVLTAVFLALTLWARTNVQAVGWKPPVTLADFGPGLRVMQAAYVWAYFLWKPLLPFDLSPYYTRLVSFQPGDWEFVLSLVIVGAITVILFLRRIRWPGLWLLWLCHLLVLAPVLGLTEHPHFTNDRYSYLAAVMWSVGLAVVMARCWVRFALRATLLVAAGVVVVILSALSLRQVAIWRDTESLGLHMIATMGDQPKRFDIYRRMATALRESDPAKANEYYLESLEGDPHAAETVFQQAQKLEASGRYREAVEQYALAAALRPDFAAPRIRLGASLLAADRPTVALHWLQEAVRLEPGSVEAQVTLGWALNRTGQMPEAIPHFETALRLQPDEAAAHSGLGVALVAIGHSREALPHFESAVRLLPASAAARFQLGSALLDEFGRKADAVAQFELVLKLQPDFPGVREALDRARH